jgi:hypothetical protein
MRYGRCIEKSKGCDCVAAMKMISFVKVACTFGATGKWFGGKGFLAKIAYTGLLSMFEHTFDNGGCPVFAGYSTCDQLQIRHEITNYMVRGEQKAIQWKAKDIKCSVHGDAQQCNASRCEGHARDKFEPSWWVPIVLAELLFWPYLLILL